MYGPPRHTPIQSEAELQRERAELERRLANADGAAQARMRAIEEGLPILRSTTTGISGVIDPRGVVREHIGMGKRARIEGNVPPAAAPTLFSILGNWLALVWALALLGGSLVVKRRRAV